MMMLPISSADLIEFLPARERVAKATAALEEAKAIKPKNKEAVVAAEAALVAAEASLAEHDPVYQLRVPTERSRARVNHDLVSEGLFLRGNADLVNVMLAATDEISPEDAAYLAGIKSAMDGDIMPDADWAKVHAIARTIPAAARIIADRLLHGSMFRIHLIRHHLVIEGKKLPLPERDFDELARSHPADLAAIGDKISELLTVSKVEAKN